MDLTSSVRSQDCSSRRLQFEIGNLRYAEFGATWAVADTINRDAREGPYTVRWMVNGAAGALVSACGRRDGGQVLIGSLQKVDRPVGRWRPESPLVGDCFIVPSLDAPR